MSKYDLMNPGCTEAMIIAEMRKRGSGVRREHTDHNSREYAAGLSSRTMIAIFSRDVINRREDWSNDGHWRNLIWPYFYSKAFNKVYVDQPEPRPQIFDLFEALV